MNTTFLLIQCILGLLMRTLRGNPMNMTLVEVHCLIRPLKKHCLPPREDDQSQLFLTESKAGTVAPPRTVNIIHQLIIMNYYSII